MAERPVFVPGDHSPYYRPVMVSFEWFGGFAVSQKQKCITGLHTSFQKRYPGKKVLESSCVIDPVNF